MRLHGLNRVWNVRIDMKLVGTTAHKTQAEARAGLKADKACASS
jgi:hypothetical protein